MNPVGWAIKAILMSTQPTLITVSSRRAARASHPLSRVLEHHASVAPRWRLLPAR